MSKPLCMTIPDTTVDRVLDSILNRGYVARDSTGRGTRMIGASEDETEREQLAERLRHA
jgi:hypothetical protein